ncbi:hypothetical protein NQZ68_021645 [Dissostichus eleginoides]|nr:hypothetical protein NQZ68_021645 [Dissostichus eleginoides]
MPGKGKDRVGGLEMPLGTVEETSVGRPFQAARPVRTEFSPESLHVNLSLLQSAGLEGWRVVSTNPPGFTPEIRRGRVEAPVRSGLTLPGSSIAFNAPRLWATGAPAQNLCPGPRT